MKLFEVLEERGMYGNYVDTPQSMPIEQRVEMMQQRFDTARKMLGLTNKLTDPEERKLHRKRVMTIMNELRNQLTALMNELADDNIDRATRYGAM